MIVYMVITALLTGRALGDVTMDAIHQGYALEVVVQACRDGNVSACHAAALGRQNAATLVQSMRDAVRDIQQECLIDDTQDECNALREVDHIAQRVLNRHHGSRT
jgi:hypothetical protein